MNVFYSIKDSWQILGRNKVRSFLTMLGIIIGVMSVVVIMSVGAGAQSLILNQITGIGSNIVGVLPGASDDEGPPASAFGIVVTTLKIADATAIMNSGDPHILAVASYVKGTDRVIAENRQTDTNFVGVSSVYTQVEDASVDNGRFFTEEEERGLAKVAVLGSLVASELFGNENPVGRKVRIKRSNFSIIGVMEPRGTTSFENQDNQIFVPITTAQKLLLGINHVSFMRIKIDEPENILSSIYNIRAVLRAQHGIDNPSEDDFSVRSTNQGLEVLSNITNAIRFFLAAIAAISLLVGGIGIMNIMLAVVEERTREIGLRKAVGATSRQIITQFLIETTLITFLGGLVGVIVGSFIALVVAEIAKSMGFSWDLVVTQSSIIIGTVISVVIGLIFGLSPARRAARLNPISALRYE